MLHKILPILVLVTATLFGDSIPTALGDQPGSQLIGETFSQELCFDNTGDATGYEPQFEVVTPAGITLTSATFYTHPTITHSETCMSNECNVTNPLIAGQNSPLSPLDANESYYILDFPIGSFPITLPQQCMDLSFKIENSGPNVQIGHEETIVVKPLFVHGETAVDDGNFTYGSNHDLKVIPNVYTIEKENNANEGERATGSSHPIRATIKVDVADGETVENLHVVDTLSGGMQFVSLDPIVGCTDSAPGLPSTSVPGGTLDITCDDNVTGILGTDIIITYEYYIPKNDNQNASIIGPVGEWQTLTNLAQANADFNSTALLPIDANSSVTAKSFVIHKSSSIEVDTAPSGFGPGDIIKYTLHIETSDYYTHDKIYIDDVLGDGQHFDKNVSYIPQYSINGGAFLSFDPANYWDCNGTHDTTDGSFVAVTVNMISITTLSLLSNSLPNDHFNVFSTASTVKVYPLGSPASSVCVGSVPQWPAGTDVTLISGPAVISVALKNGIGR